MDTNSNLSDVTRRFVWQSGDLVVNKPLHNYQSARALAQHLLYARARVLGGPGSGPRKRTDTNEATPAVTGFGKIRPDLLAQEEWEKQQPGMDTVIDRWSDYLYKNINSSIRDGNPNPDAASLMNALNKVPPLEPPPVVVWRGLWAVSGGW